MGRLLVIVDMQNDFIDGSLGTKEAEAIVDRVKEKAKAYESAGDEIVFTLDTHGENYMDTQEGKNLPVRHCIKGTAGWEICDKLKDFEGKRFEKPSFGSAILAHYAASGTYDSIELAGLCTDICVISNALLIKAAAPEVPVIVDGACCAGVTPKSHDNALEAMKMCQVQVI